MNRSTFFGRNSTTRSRRAWSRISALGAGIGLASGCYSYVPTEMAAVPPGEHVRLMVTREGSEEIARVSDTDLLRPVVRGQLVGTEDRMLLVRIPMEQGGEMSDGATRLALGQVVRIPEGEVLTVDRRQFSTIRTAGLAAATAAVGAFLLFNIFDVFSDPGRDGGPDPVLIRIPIG